jgi:hypothetical protein
MKPRETVVSVDIIMLDTSVLRDIARGNAQAAEALSRRLKAGGRVYVSRLAYRELVLDAPTPELRQQWRLLLKDAKIRIAPKSPISDRVDVYEANVRSQKFKMTPDEKKAWKEKNWKLKETKPEGGLVQYKKGPGGLKEDFTRPGDVFVAAEAKSVKARLWTFDGDMRIRGARQGVEIANESTLPVKGTGKDSPMLAREKLGIKEPVFRKLAARIDIRARAIRLARGARGMAGGVGGTVLSFGIQIGLHFLQKWMMQGALEDKIKDGLKAAQAKIEEKANALKPQIALLQLQDRIGQKIFLQVTIEVHSVTRSVRLKSYTDVEVHLGDVHLSHGEVEDQRTYKKRGRTIQEITQSFEVAVYTPDELAIFWEWADEYAQNKSMLQSDPSDDIIKKEQARLRSDIVALFGPDIWFFDEQERRMHSRYQ